MLPQTPIALADLFSGKYRFTMHGTCIHFREHGNTGPFYTQDETHTRRKGEEKDELLACTSLHHSLSSISAKRKMLANKSYQAGDSHRRASGGIHGDVYQI